MDLKNIRTIVFDFDGVIVRDSEFLKDQAWENIFKTWPNWDTSARFVFHESLKKNVAAGKSRFEIVSDFFCAIGMNEREVIELTAEYVAKFEIFVQKEILNLGVMDRDKEALTYLSAKFPLCINSATPEDSLQRTVLNLGLASFFRCVYGRPATKQENMYRVARVLELGVSDILFVGDGPGDVAAWVDTGCQFVGIANRHNEWAKKPFPLLSSISELPDLLFPSHR